ncbi:uncharacterized protein LY79DRAFT_534179 [Colletotrichum navitas]|uniref:Secreted protein n=1 Tax=Colletotrichum navitas TaxID=681940 RepID=A0AAD8QDF7_9PEZI|nr:uncharacterized protein LY79DRAFT_534179 [Colletotrichum navitas]KAK1600616.1 hypothetical protein LY79DRAFT_534179 [Colletotrichum navitas]
MASYCMCVCMCVCICVCMCRASVGIDFHFGLSQFTSKQHLRYTTSTINEYVTFKRFCSRCLEAVTTLIVDLTIPSSPVVADVPAPKSAYTFRPWLK